MTTKQPISEIRLGRITAAIWKNETSKGTYYNVSFSRLYKEGQEWKRSDSFGRDDLLVLAKLADLTHTRVYKLQTTEADRAEKDCEQAA